MPSRVVHSEAVIEVGLYNPPGPFVSAPVGGGIVGGVYPESNNFIGPFIDGNGNQYTITEVSVASPAPAMRKSTDGGLTWAEVDVAGRPAWSSWGDLESCWAIQDGTRLYIGNHRGGSTNRYDHFEFATSDDGSDPDNWQTPEQVSTNAANPPNDQAGCLVRRGSDLYAFWNYFDGTDDKIAWKKKSGGSWGTENYITTSGKVLRQPVSIQKPYGSSDTIYLVVHNDTDNTLQYYTISTGDTVTGPTSFATNPSTTNYHPIVSPGVRYSAGATDRITFAYQNTSDTISCKDFDNGTLQSEQTVSDNSAWADPTYTTSRQPVATLAVDDASDLVYCLYADASAHDIYQATRTAGTWGTDVEIQDAVECQFLSANVFTRSGTKYLAYVWDSCPTGLQADAVVTYNEINLGAAAPGVVTEGIVTGEAFGTSKIVRLLRTTGLATAEALGAPDTNFVLRPSGTASLEAHGQPYANFVLRPGGTASTEAFGANKVIRVLRETGITTAEAFGQPDVNSILRALGITTAEAFGTLGKVRFVVKPTGLVTAEAFGKPGGMPGTGGAFTVATDGVLTGEAFGEPDLNRILRALGITGAEAFGQADTNLVLRPTGVASAEAFGTLAKLLRQLRPTGLASAEAFGTTDVNRILRIVGIATAEAFGNSDTNFAVRTSGITTAEAFGQLGKVRFIVKPIGLASAEAFGKPGGMPGESSAYTIALDGVLTGEAFGEPDVNRILRAIGVSTAEGFGSSRLRPIVRPSGLASGEAFGDTDVNRRIRLLGIATAEAFGQPTRPRHSIYAQALASAEAFGQPRVLRRISVIGITTGEEFGIALLGDDSVLVKPSVPGQMLLSDTATWELVLSDGELYLIGVDDVPAYDIWLTDHPGG
jgi:hypothetical protein